jgi:hypothetical protein
MPVTITREQRDALYAEVVLMIASPCEALMGALGGARIEEALATRARLNDELRLLDDLGWWPVDERETYALTMPQEQLERVVSAFLTGTEGSLRDYTLAMAHGRESMEPEDEYQARRENRRQLADRDLELHSACVAVLEQMGGK